MNLFEQAAKQVFKTLVLKTLKEPSDKYDEHEISVSSKEITVVIAYHIYMTEPSGGTGRISDKPST